MITNSGSHSCSFPSRGVWPLSVEASGLVLFALCVSPILGHARALRPRVHLALSNVSLSFVALSLSLSGATSLAPLSSRLVARLSLSLSTCPSSRLSPLLFRLLYVAGQPAFNYIVSSQNLLTAPHMYAIVAIDRMKN